MFASFFINGLQVVQHIRKPVLGFVLAISLVACGGPSTQGPVPQEVVRPQLPEQADRENGQDFQQTEQQEPARAQTEGTDDTKIIVAVMLPLSGPEAETGKALLRAATMALFDAYDPRIRLMPFDTQADAIIAEEQAREAIRAGADVVLGPLLSDSVATAGAVFGEANITMIGFSNDSTVAAPGRYVMGFLPETEVKRVVDFAVASGLRDFGALIPEGLYGQRVQAAFGDTIVEAGAHISAIESYPPGTADALDEPVKRLARYDERRRDARREIQFLRGLRDQLTNEIAEKIEDAEVLEGVDFDAVLVPEGGAVMRSLAPLLPFYEIDPNLVRLLGTGLWNDPGLLGEPPMQGAWFAAPEPEQPDAFLARFEQVYGEPAPRIATLVYDAMSLVAGFARTPVERNQPELETKPDTGATPQGELETGMVNYDVHKQLFSPERFTPEEGFVGVDGLFRFLPDGKIERALAILEVRRSGFVVVDPAPKSFPAFGYLLN